MDGYEIYQAWWVETGQPVEPEEWASAIEQGLDSVCVVEVQIEYMTGKVSKEIVNKK